jgi:hypothetical protein
VNLNYKVRKKRDSSHKVEDTSTSDVAVEILNSSLQSVGKSPVRRKQL